MNLTLIGPKGPKIKLIGAALTAVLLVGCSADEGGTVSVPVPTPVPVPSGPSPTITLTATPANLAAGGTTSISHNATDAQTCVASGAWTGDKGPSGTETITVPSVGGSYTYTLTCTSSTGQQTAQSVTVTVTGTAGDPGAITGEPNDGTTPTTIIEGGAQLPNNFVCTASARTYGPNPVTAVNANGLVGDALSGLLGFLGAGTVIDLQNSITAKELAVDGNLGTAAGYNLSVGLLGGAISSLDLFVGLNSPAPAQKYATFLVSFPIATVELSLLQSITVSTFLNGELQETEDIDASTLDLVGQVATGDPLRFVGLKATVPYDAATISLSPTLVSANVGNAMNVHELCTDGFFVAPPAP